MATKPINAYTVQEATNLNGVYENYSAGSMTLSDADVSGGVNVEEFTDWISSGDGPAKKIMIFAITGNAGDDILIYLKINGSYGNAITIEHDNFPVTFDNLLIDQIKISSDDSGSTDEKYTILSFH